MLTYARTKDANATQDNYFQIVSSRRLGQTQTVQFQSGNQYGTNWIWGSKCTADNTCDPNAIPANNALTEMPRSYHQGNDSIGDYYNYYAATAGTATFESLGNASDSICPKGWQLSDNTPGSGKSWYDLLVSAYELNTNSGDGSGGTKTAAESEVAGRKAPLSLQYSGHYRFRDGDILYRGIAGSFTSSYSELYNGANGFIKILGWWNSSPVPTHTEQKPSGFSIRCVKK